MANPTTNFGWVMPTSANLIGDLPTNFATFGQGVDTTFVDLTGGTTDAVLMKQSATLADFKWGGLWATYTPTYTNFTLGNGTVDVARYCQVGKVVFLELQMTMGTTSSVTGLIRISLPVTAANIANTLQGGCLMVDSGTATYSGVSALISTTQVALYALNSSTTYLGRSNTSATIPHTWASTDVFSALIFYEAA